MDLVVRTDMGVLGLQRVGAGSYMKNQNVERISDFPAVQQPVHQPEGGVILRVWTV